MSKITVAKLRPGWVVPHFTQCHPVQGAIEDEIRSSPVRVSEAGNGLVLIYDASARAKGLPFNRAIKKSHEIQYRIFGTLIIARREGGVYVNLTEADREALRAGVKRVDLVNLDQVGRVLQGGAV